MYDPMRRNRIDQRTSAETAISNAMSAVEEAGAHPLLTDAVVLLGQARDKVADFVDEVPRVDPEHMQKDKQDQVQIELASMAASEPILKFFAYGHLPQPLQDISSPFANVALLLMVKLGRSAERAVALRKLLEGKDAAVRAAL